ncbi:hypothetical protein Hanom_Chr17g01588351 [Helianthus anomalus]
MHLLQGLLPQIVCLLPPPPNHFITVITSAVGRTVKKKNKLKMVASCHNQSRVCVMM